VKLVRNSGSVLNGAPQFVGRPEGELVQRVQKLLMITVKQFKNGESFHTFLATKIQISQQSAKRFRWGHS
jgi:hypothetical protein